MNYSTITNDAAIKGHEINHQSITVWFHGVKRPFTYSYHSAGSHHVRKMKKLACQGDDLHSYINEHVKRRFVR